VTVSTPQPNLPDYQQLVKFLFQPFLSEADAISIDCEYTIDRQRVWIRVAVATSDRDTAIGRGGRNVQAIRTVLQAAASAVGQTVHLDVYGTNSGSRHLDAERTSSNEQTDTERRPPRAKPSRPTPGPKKPAS
jgi:uncharacterized protein